MKRPFRIGAAAASSLLLGGCGLTLQQLPKIGGIGGPTYPLTAHFADVLNLPANAQVREGPTVVGQVTSIRAEDFEAVVGMRIRRNVSLPEGTTAEVRFDNPLGEEYVLLTPPPGSGGAGAATTGALAPGSTIPEQSTDTAPSVEDTFAALSTVLNGGGIAQLGTIIHELNQTFAGNQPQIRDLLHQIDVAVGSLASSSTSVDNALAAIGNLVQGLNSQSGTIVTGIATIAPAIGVLSSENTQLQQLLNGFTNLSSIGQALLAQSGQNTVTAIQSLQPVVQELVGVEQQLGPDLADLSEFEAKTPGIIPGNYLQVSVTANVILNSAPTVASVAAASAGPGPKSGAAAVGALLEAGSR